MRMKSLNLYRSDGDREVWEQAELDAKAAGISLSAFVVAVLRERTKPTVRISDKVVMAYENGRERQVLSDMAQRPKMPDEMVHKVLAQRTLAGLTAAFEAAGIEVVE